MSFQNGMSLPFNVTFLLLPFYHIPTYDFRYCNIHTVLHLDQISSKSFLKPMALVLYSYKVVNQFNQGLLKPFRLQKWAQKFQIRVSKILP